MTPEDEEFNRLEMESKVRQEYVRQQLKKIPVVHIPTITEEEWKALNEEKE